MSIEIRETRADTQHEIVLDAGLLDAAQYMREHPRQLETLVLFMNGNIHKKEGGSIKQQSGRDEPPIVFWHQHGTFVAPDGAIYHARTDDNDNHRQIYMSPVDEYDCQPYCVQPLTYDGHTGPYGITMRFDFKKNLHGMLPSNSTEDVKHQIDQYREMMHAYDAEKARLEAEVYHERIPDDKMPEYWRRYKGDVSRNYDIMTPRHKEWAEANRDSLSLKKFEDGHIEAVLHDGETEVDTKLYSADVVIAAIGILDSLGTDVDKYVHEDS